MNPLTQDECRREFEAWASIAHHEVIGFSLRRRKDGYQVHRIQWDWKAWQAAWNHRSPAREEGGKGGDEQPVESAPLLPCPHCGGSPTVWCGGFSCGSFYRIECRACKEAFDSRNGYSSKELAGAAWNTRFNSSVTPIVRESVAPNHQPSAHQSKQGGSVDEKALVRGYGYVDHAITPTEFREAIEAYEQAKESKQPSNTCDDEGCEHYGTAHSHGKQPSISEGDAGNKVFEALHEILHRPKYTLDGAAKACVTALKPYLNMEK